MVLMGYIDDTTSCFFGRFYDYEGVYPAMVIVIKPKFLEPKAAEVQGQLIKEKEIYV